jgi:hypothetical protein
MSYEALRQHCRSADLAPALEMQPAEGLARPAVAEVQVLRLSLQGVCGFALRTRCLHGLVHMLKPHGLVTLPIPLPAVLQVLFHSFRSKALPGCWKLTWHRAR